MPPKRCGEWQGLAGVWQGVASREKVSREWGKNKQNGVKAKISPKVLPVPAPAPGDNNILS